VSRHPHGTVAKTTDPLINCHRGLLTKRAPLPLNGQRRAINIARERRRGIAGPHVSPTRSPIAVRGNETHRTADKNRPTSLASFFSPFFITRSRNYCRNSRARVIAIVTKCVGGAPRPSCEFQGRQVSVSDS